MLELATEALSLSDRRAHAMVVTSPAHLSRLDVLRLDGHDARLQRCSASERVQRRRSARDVEWSTGARAGEREGESERRVSRSRTGREVTTSGGSDRAWRIDSDSSEAIDSVDESSDTEDVQAIRGRAGEPPSESRLPDVNAAVRSRSPAHALNQGHRAVLTPDRSCPRGAARSGPWASIATRARPTDCRRCATRAARRRT